MLVKSNYPNPEKRLSIPPLPGKNQTAGSRLMLGIVIESPV